MRLAYLKVPRVKTNLEKSPIDRRDHQMQVVRTNTRLRPMVNLKKSLPFVYDQGSIGSCTANSTASMYSWVVLNSNGTVEIPSRLFLYYNTRKLQGTISFDSGATLRDTMKSLQKDGICAETSWAYLYENLFKTPPPNCYDEASFHQALSYASVPISLINMKNVLQSRPFVLGILVYSSFFTPSVSKTGQIPFPNMTKEKLLGGHAILVLGYDDRRKAFYCRNSWGQSWGLKGDFYLPYSYATNRKLAFDAWVLYSVELDNMRVIKKL